MSSQGVDSARRRFLTGAATVVGGVGTAFAAWPFASSWQPSERARAIGAPIEVDIGKLEPGQRIIQKWQGKPVWIVRRTKQALDSLTSVEGEVRDPASEEDQQPEYARNPHRSINPEYLILVGICTHLGCSPLYYRRDDPHPLGSDWKGGFFCPCHGSKFDFAAASIRGFRPPRISSCRRTFI